MQQQVGQAPYAARVALMQQYMEKEGTSTDSSNISVSNKPVAMTQEELAARTPVSKTKQSCEVELLSIDSTCAEHGGQNESVRPQFFVHTA